RVQEPVSERAHIALRVVEFDAVVIAGQHVIPVDVICTGRLSAVVGHDPQRVAKAADLVVAHHVTAALDIDARGVRVRAAIVRIDPRPVGNYAGEVIVADVKVGLIADPGYLHRADPNTHVSHRNAPDDVRGGWGNGRRLDVPQPDATRRPLHGEVLDVHVAA